MQGIRICKRTASPPALPRESLRRNCKKAVVSAKQQFSKVDLANIGVEKMTTSCTLAWSEATDASRCHFKTLSVI